MERVGYNGYVIDARVHALRDGGYNLTAVIERHTEQGVHRQEFPVAAPFTSEDEAEEAAIPLAQQLIDAERPGLTI